MGSRNRTKERRPQHTPRENILSHPIRAKGTARIHQGTPAERIHPPFEKSIRRPILLHQEERWKAPPRSRLPSDKQMDHKKSLSTPPYPGTHQPGQRRNTVLEIRREMGLQQRSNQKGRRVESSIHHQPRPIRTKSHVLRTHKLASNLPNNDERNLSGRAPGRMGVNIHGRHPNPHRQQPPPPQKVRPSNPRQNSRGTTYTSNPKNASSNKKRWNSSEEC